MSVYQCCDCGEIKASKSDLEAHLNSDHIGWSPYQCYYCCQQGVCTRKPNKEMLRDHVTQRHPDQEFTFIYTDDNTNKERLKEMLMRSTSHIQSPDVTRNTPSVTMPSPDEMVSPFMSSSPLQPKEEIVDIAEFQGHSTSIGDGNKTLDEIEKEANDDTDIIRNTSVLDNCRCETCHESFPRNLIIIRDHVKVHFKEKTGCVAADLTLLLPSLQQIYWQLLMTSFPSVGASMLNDDIPNCNPTTNQEETVDNRTIHDMDNKGDENPENDAVLVANDLVSHDNSDSNVHYCCKKCGTKFRRLASLKWHLRRYCKFIFAKEESKSATTLAQTTPHQNPIDDFSCVTVHVACDVCGQKYLSMCSMHIHRFNKHGITVQWHCKQCNLDFQKSSGFHTHLLQVHLHKRLHECSICGIGAQPSTIGLHDKRLHGGLGKALIVNNLHRYKDHVELLRRTLIIDKNSSLIAKTELTNSSKLGTSTKLPLRNILSLKRKDKTSTKKRSPARLVEVKTETQNPSCEICDQTFASQRAMKIHRANKHGILVKWHCKKCNINLGSSSILKHLLIVHLGKKASVCSLCNSKTAIRKLADHDRHCHGGLGDAQIINNIDGYRKEIEELRNTLIFDVNAMGKVENSQGNNSISPQRKSIKQLIPKLQLKSKNPAASESVEWMLRFKRSQKRKRGQQEVLPFKRFGDIHATMKP